MNTCTHGYVVGSCALCSTPEDAEMYSRMLLRAFREKPDNQSPEEFIVDLNKRWRDGYGHLYKKPGITPPAEKTPEEIAAFVKYILNQGYIP